MPKADKIILSFNAGELSPRMVSRIDQDKYAFGARTMENFYPLIYGGAERRPGTEYIADAKSNSAQSVLIPFEHSVDDTYVIEFANQTLRFFKDGGIINGNDGSETLAPDNIIAHWLLNDNEADTIVLDDDGNTHPGVATTNTQNPNFFATGKVGTGCKDFRGVFAISVADHTDFSFIEGVDGDFSLMAWVYVTSDAGPSTIIANYDGNAEREWRFRITTNRFLQLNLYDETNDISIHRQADTALVNGWHLVVATYEGEHGSWSGATAANFITLYVDGEVVASTATNDVSYVKMVDSGADVTIGAHFLTDPALNHIYRDRIDNVAVFGDVLSAAEVLALRASDAYEVTTPYLTADLPFLKFVHSADVMYITHPDYEMRKLSRIGDAAWTLEALAIEDGPFRVENDDVTKILNPDGTTGSIGLVAEGFSPFVADSADGHLPNGSTETDKAQTGTLYRLVQAVDTPSVNEELESETDNDATGTLTVYKGVTWDYTTNGTWGAADDPCTVVLERSYDSGTTFETLVTTVSAANKNTVTTGTEEEADAIYRARVDVPSTANTSVTVQISVRDSSHIGVVEITSITSPTVAVATVLTTLGSNKKTHRWSEGAYSNFRGWPVDVTISAEERLTFTGNPSQPLTTWGSISGDFTSFKEGTLDDDAITQTLVGSGQQNQIQWALTKNTLIMGTVGGEHLLGASNIEEALTPDNVRAKLQTTYGSENIAALVVNQAVLFAQRGGRKIREFVSQFDPASGNDNYVADDLTVFAEHITESGIANMSFQRTPDPMVWCGRTDGQVAVMSYERAQNVFGWSRIVTQTNAGTATKTDSVIESMAVIYGGAGNEDEVWCSVKRVIDSSTVRRIERFKPRDWGSDDEDAFFVDSGLTYDSSATSTISGLDHLEGETVSVYADGVVFDDATVSGGVITLKLATVTTQASKAQIGLPYTSTLKPMRLSLSGLGLAPTQKIPSLRIDLFKTMHGKIGTTTDNATPIVYRNAGATGTEFPMFSDHTRHAPRGGFSHDGDIVVVQDKPVPMTVLSLTLRLGVNND